MEISTSELKQAIVKAHMAGQDLARVPQEKYAQDYYRKEFLQMMGIINESPNQELNIDAPESCPLYTDYKKSCQALKDRYAELLRTT